MASPSASCATTSKPQGPGSSTVPNVGKVNLVGAQDEIVYLEFSTQQMAALGLTQQTIINALSAQNAVSPSGTVEANGERVSVRTNGQFGVGERPEQGQSLDQ